MTWIIVAVRPQVARLSEAVTITIGGTGNCRFSVDFGNGESRTVTARLPHQLSYRYRQAGSYEIVVGTPDQSCTGGGDAVLLVRRR